MELALKYAVQSIENDDEILPNITVEYDIHYVHRDDSFHTAKNGTPRIPTHMKKLHIIHWSL